MVDIRLHIHVLLVCRATRAHVQQQCSGVVVIQEPLYCDSRANFENVTSCSSHKETFLIWRLHSFQCSFQVCSMCYASVWERLFISLRAAYSILTRSRPQIFNTMLHVTRTTFPWLLRLCTSICVTGSNAVGSWLPSLGTSGSVRLFARQDQVPLVAGHLPLASPGLYVYCA